MADPEFTDLQNRCIESLFSCADNISKYIDTGKEVELNNLRMCLKNYCLLEAQQNAKAKVLNEIKCSKETHTSSVDELCNTAFKQLKQITQESAMNTHPILNELEKRIQKNKRLMSQNFDLDVALNESESSERSVDPMTKKPIQNPLRNTNCNHVYERDVILDHIKKKKKVKCPVAGCISQQPLQIENLISDEEFRFQNSIPHRSTMLPTTSAAWSQEY